MRVAKPPPPSKTQTKLGLKILGPVKYSIERRTRSDPTAVPDQQARCNGCILPASTAPLDNVMCQYKALKLHQQVASAMVTGDRAEERNAQCGKRVRTLHH